MSDKKNWNYPNPLNVADELMDEYTPAAFEDIWDGNLMDWLLSEFGPNAGITGKVPKNVYNEIKKYIENKGY
jgi:hypothetical protein